MPVNFRSIGCVSCYSAFNHLMIINNATTKYVDAVEAAMKKQKEDFGIVRSLKDDYKKNTAFAAPGNYYKPNMNTFNSANGYFKVCASLALNITKR
jgi:hypothetical protein